MNPKVIAQARRLYHHVLHGGTLRPEDVSFMVEVLEKAEKQRVEIVEAMEEAVYLLSPTDEDMQKHAGVYRIVTTLEKLKEKNA